MAIMVLSLPFALLVGLTSTSESVFAVLAKRGLGILVWVAFLTFFFDKFCLCLKLYDKLDVDDGLDFENRRSQRIEMSNSRVK